MSPNNRIAEHFVTAPYAAAYDLWMFVWALKRCGCESPSIEAMSRAARIILSQHDECPWQ